jgi:hypothetical protein
MKSNKTELELRLRILPVMILISLLLELRLIVPDCWVPEAYSPLSFKLYAKKRLGWIWP